MKKNQKGLPANALPEAAASLQAGTHQALQAGFAHIILVLVIVAVAIGGAYYSGTLKSKNGLSRAVPTSTPSASDQLVVIPTFKPTTDPTANWKTYTNDIYNFSFKYPSDWNINCPAVPVTDWYDRNICDIISPNAFAEGGEVNNGSYFVVGVSKPNPNYSDFNRFLEYSRQYGYAYENKQINNIQGKLASIKNKMTNFMFESNGNFVNTTWLYSDNSKMVDLILSTFQFTK